MLKIQNIESLLNVFNVSMFHDFLKASKLNFVIFGPKVGINFNFRTNTLSFKKYVKIMISSHRTISCYLKILTKLEKITRLKY